MQIYDRLTVIIFTLLIRVLRILKTGGTSLPGKLALKFNKQILKKLSDQKKIIVVTGTNGKTTTSRIIANILSANNKTFFTNKSGANLLSGITSTFIENFSNETDYVLLEIDEAAFSLAADHFSPMVVIVTNFYRDQLDRYGELYSTLDKVDQGISKNIGSLLILNGDDSLCASIGRDHPSKVIYYGFSDIITSNNHEHELSDSTYCIYCRSKYEYLSRTIGHLGHFKCNNCGYRRPDLDVILSNIVKQTKDSTEVTITIDNKTWDARIGLPAIYNVYNALSALSLAKALGFDMKKSISALSSFESGFGRMEKIEIGNKKINIMLVKNPTGFNSALEYLLSINTKYTVCFSINDNTADGKDVSWLWDVNFEKLKPLIDNNIQYIICSGKRAYDMALRLKYMGVAKEKLKIEQSYQEMIELGLANTQEKSTLYVLPTYTSMLDIRKILQKKYKLKEIWK